ncbi:MAG: hypothetical protein QQN41_06280 [Nitrosopumilus sp.]
MRPIRESLFEAKLNLPQEYIDKVRGEAKETIGLGGPSHEEMQQMRQLLNQIFQIQRGHEEKLTEIGITIIQKFYGPILEGVELDVKIVDPNDEEKLEMTQKMIQQEQPQQEGQPPPPVEVELELPGIEKDIDKRKLINNIMQGEAQNVHSMMYDLREQITEITGNAELLGLYMQFLDINRKFDWDESINLQQMMEQMPQMANAMETEWEGDEEGGDDTPKIKARVLDLPMLIHETVKGIYELISAGAIDPDPVRAQKILKATESLTDEQEDIRYGPFIARDIRNYVNKVADGISGAHDVPNLREFVFGKMIRFQSEQFVELVTGMLLNKDGPSKIIAKFINEILEEFREYNLSKVPGYERDEDDEALPAGDIEEEPGEQDNELINLMNKSKEKSEEEPEDKRKKYADMGKNELEFQLNKAIDDKDWKTAQEIGQALERKGSRGIKESNEFDFPEKFGKKKENFEQGWKGIELEKFEEENLPGGVEEEEAEPESEPWWKLNLKGDKYKPLEQWWKGREPEKFEEENLPNGVEEEEAEPEPEPWWKLNLKKEDQYKPPEQSTGTLEDNVFTFIFDNTELSVKQIDDLLYSDLFDELEKQGLTVEEISQELIAQSGEEWF